MDTRWKSGQQTEKSMLSLWQVCFFQFLCKRIPLTPAWQCWVPITIAAGTISDHIVGANHTMEYLKYPATRSLLTTQGHPKEGPAWLSLVRGFPLYSGIAHWHICAIVIIKKEHDHAWLCPAATVRRQPHPARTLAHIDVEEPGFLQGSYSRILLYHLTILPSYLVLHTYFTQPC